jgi:hypothetical protein
MKDEIKHEIQALLAELVKSKPDQESAEGVAGEYLKCLLAGSENRHMGIDFTDLKRFWLESVPWCSELSLRIEKIIIMNDEYNDQDSHEQNKF